MTPDPFTPWLARWRLTPDGPPRSTRSSRLLPVIHRGSPAMLKIATNEEERRGAILMGWYAGDGAARVLAHADDALLMERLAGVRDLAGMARTGRDDEASAILCGVAQRLHVPRGRPPPEGLVPLPVWFNALETAAARDGGAFARAATAARALLGAPQETVVLHGDIHHGNVLDGGARGWLAIDPKGLIGERGFDYANLLRNPDAGAALSPGRLRRQAGIIAERAGLPLPRLLAWTLAYAGLGAAWSLEGGQLDAATGLAISGIAAAALEACGTG